MKMLGLITFWDKTKINKMVYEFLLALKNDVLSNLTIISAVFGVMIVVVAFLVG